MSTFPSFLKFSTPAILIGDECISVANKARNIGSSFLSNYYPTEQISLTCQSALFLLRNIAKIRQYLDFK
jgi:hypothetical protein